MRMLSGRVGRDDGLGALFGEPVAQALGVAGSVGDEAPRARRAGEQIARSSEVVGIAGCEQEADRPAAIIRQRMDFRGAPAA